MKMDTAKGLCEGALSGIWSTHGFFKLCLLREREIWYMDVESFRFECERQECCARHVMSDCADWVTPSADPRKVHASNVS
jgi:hypothetical protein